MDSKEGNENKISEKCFNEDCKGKVLESVTLSECPSVSKDKFPHYKIPMILSEFTVQIDIESRIKLAEPAIEIKRIKKNVFLTECRLVGKTNKLFLKGFIRKNIEYATEKSSNADAICGDIKHTTVHIPFHCITELDCLREPEIYANPVSEETVYWNEKNMGRDMKETDLYSEEIFNEKIYCELLKARIYEADIAKEFEKGSCDSVEHVFRSFIEKEILYLSIKLLQNKQVWSWELCQAKSAAAIKPLKETPAEIILSTCVPNKETPKEDKCCDKEINSREKI